MSESPIEQRMIHLSLEDLEQMIWDILKKNPLYGSFLDRETEEYEKMSAEDSSRLCLGQLELIKRIENLTGDELKKTENRVADFLMTGDAISIAQTTFIAYLMKEIGKREKQLSSQSLAAAQELALVAEVKKAIAKLAPHTQN